jgi:hypothetical protein
MAHIPTWLAVVDRGILWLLVRRPSRSLRSMDDLLIDLLWASAWLIERLHPSAHLFPPENTS